MNKTIEKYYPHVYYNGEKLSYIIKNLPSGIDMFLVRDYHYPYDKTNTIKMCFYTYKRVYSNFFNDTHTDILFITPEEFDNTISMLERDAKLKEAMSIINGN